MRYEYVILQSQNLDQSTSSFLKYNAAYIVR